MYVAVAVAGLWSMWKDLELLLLDCVMFQREHGAVGREDDTGGRDIAHAAKVTPSSTEWETVSTSTYACNVARQLRRLLQQVVARHDTALCSTAERGKDNGGLSS